MIGMDGLDSFKTILERLISFPLRNQVQMNFDLKKQIFRLTVPIFSSKKSLPPVVKGYVEARQGRAFKPHATTFVLEEDKKVLLVQEFPFQWGFQPTSLRDQIYEFCRLAKQCHRILMELAVEETYKDALQS